MAQPTLWNFPQLLLLWCACFCPEFALPLSIWLNNGWHGLLLHGRAALRVAPRAGNARSEVMA